MATHKSSTKTSPDPAQAPDPSLPLKNTRQEKFAYFIVRGSDVGEAFIKAGYPKNKSNANRLMKDPAVVARIEFLQTQATLLTVYDATWVKDRLARHAEALTEVIVTEDGSKKPGPLFNPSAGNRALELLGKEHGMFKDKIELGGKVQIANRELFEKLTPEERANLRAMLITAAARMPRPANENDDGDAGDGKTAETAVK